MENIQGNDLLKFIGGFLAITIIALNKMLGFGQTELFMKSDFSTFWNNLLTIPSFGIELSSFSIHQFDHSLYSNGVTYQNILLRGLLIVSTKAYRLFWPTLFCLMIATFLISHFLPFILKLSQANPTDTAWYLQARVDKLKGYPRVFDCPLRKRAALFGV